MLWLILNAVNKLIPVFAWVIAVAFVASCVHDELTGSARTSGCDTVFVTDTVYIYVHSNDTFPNIMPPLPP